jgi:hypothetical protein
MVLSHIKLSKASCIRYSDSESKLEVASSMMRILLFESNALAIATLCFSHHESFIHLSHTNVLYQSGSLDMNS